MKQRIPINCPQCNNESHGKDSCHTCKGVQMYAHHDAITGLYKSVEGNQNSYTVVYYDENGKCVDSESVRPSQSFRPY